LTDNAEEILRGLRASDPQAWEQFHAQFWKPTLAVVSRKFPDLAASDLSRDVAMDTLMAVVRQVQSGVEVNPATLRGYVMQIALRKGLHAVLARRAEKQDLPLDRSRHGTKSWHLGHEGANFDQYIAQQPDPRPNPEQQLQVSRKAAHVEAAMLQLRPTDRDILQRFYFGGETKEQIMASYAISEDQFRRYKSRALTRLMAHLYGEHSAMSSETGAMYTRKALRELVGPCQH
jgi:RNA polymerase sigma factor (sigma-70 family)